MQWKGTRESKTMMVWGSKWKLKLFWAWEKRNNNCCHLMVIQSRLSLRLCVLHVGTRQEWNRVKVIWQKGGRRFGVSLSTVINRETRLIASRYPILGQMRWNSALWLPRPMGLSDESGRRFMPHAARRSHSMMKNHRRAFCRPPPAPLKWPDWVAESAVPGDVMQNVTDSLALTRTPIWQCPKLSVLLRSTQS